MKKTTLAIALATSLGTGVASAAVVNFTSGTFTMYDPTGAVVGGSAVVTGSLDDNGTLAGVNLTSPTAFFGFKWTAHDSTCSTPGGVGDTLCNLPFDWGATANIPVVVHWDTGTAGVWSTLDGDANGIPGTAMTAGPFAGFSPTFTLNYETTVIPVPAAAWLFGSGLVGLVGVARRRRKA